jgi:hypothetical protein
MPVARTLSALLFGPSADADIDRQPLVGRIEGRGPWTHR